MYRRDFVKKTGLLTASASLMSLTNETRREEQPTILPKGLLKGDLIAITAPAGGIWNDHHIHKVQLIIEEMGFHVKIGESNYNQIGYLAGSDESRAKELMGFFKDKSVKAILTMRGGWGCARILDLLDYNEIKENPKIIMGFSDITSLINAIYTKTGLVTYHGPCGYSSWGDFTRLYVTKSIVDGRPYQMANNTSSKLDLRTLTSGKSTGKLIGGNLTVLVSLIGTKYEPDWAEKIVFIEDTSEEPYRIDRMLWQMKQNGIFNQINGLVIGSFNKCEPEEPEKSFSLHQVFVQHFKNTRFPVYQGASFGHIADKFTLPIGTEAEINANTFTISTLTKSVHH